MQRREFLQAGAAFGAVMSTGFLFGAEEAKSDPFTQPKLPYALDALQPFLTEEQMSYHYGKHHAGYFKKLKELLDGKPEAKLSLEEIVRKSEPGAVFNNAAQAWNHTFFWNCMAPKGKGGNLDGKLLDRIRTNFGNLEAFLDEFQKKAVGIFGSGWCWLAADADGKLDIQPLSNADTPLKHGKKPLLVVDVWEHAYYVDYRNDRAKFVKTFLDFVNWNFVAENYGR